MKSTLIKLVVVTSLFLSNPGFAAAMKLEMIQLNYRTAEELIPILQPLVSGGGSLTGVSDQLIVKTTPDNLAEIKHILAGIDKAARRLMITVKQDIQGEINRRE